MAHIFISYKSETEKQALAVVQQLEEAGIDCWIACRDIPVGTDYIDEIPAAIDDSPFFILLLSSKIHISPWVKLELKQAISSGKHVLPLMIEDCQLHRSYTFMLQNYQIYPLFNDDGETFQEVISRIYKVLPELRPKPAAPAPKPKVPAVAKPIQPNQTDGPYIFINYAHKDVEQVMPIIQLLQEKGFRVWFDQGLEFEMNWSEIIINNLNKCCCVLSFLSQNFQNSPNCTDELNFAINKRKLILPVYLEEILMAPGLLLQLSRHPSLSLHRLESNEQFVALLEQMPVLNKCRNK